VRSSLRSALHDMPPTWTTWLNGARTVVFAIESHRSPRFLWDPHVDPCPALRPRGETHTRHCGVGLAAFHFENSVGFRFIFVSRLNHTAWRLPVYASQPRSPLHHATLGSGPGALSTEYDPSGPINRRLRASADGNPQANTRWRSAPRARFDGIGGWLLKSSASQRGPVAYGIPPLLTVPWAPP
jgi:hypothetical protein